MQSFGLMWNHGGYAARGSKRLLVRQYDVSQPGKPVSFELRKDGVSLTLPPPRRLDTFGCRLWVCDFTQVKECGAYEAVVFLSDSCDILVCPVTIDENPFLDGWAMPAAIDNAQARYASELPGKGFYDCNSTMGESYSHGMYLNGLCSLLEQQGTRWSQQEREGILTSANIALDYLLRLWQEDGIILNHAPERAYDAHNFSIGDTVEAIYGMSAALPLLRGTYSPEKVEAILCKLEKSFRTVLDTEDVKGRYPLQEWIAPVACRLYRLTGQSFYLDKAMENVLDIAQHFDWPGQSRGGWRSFSFFEGTYYLSLEQPDILAHPSVAGMLEKARYQLREQMNRNAFGFPAPSDGEHAREEWLHPEAMLHGAGKRRWFLCNDVLAAALDACFLGLLTGDQNLEECAAGCLHFIFGMHFGISGRYVRGMEEYPDNRYSVSMMACADEGIMPWREWFFTMKNRTWRSIVNGFTVESGAYFYSDEDWPHGETFIKTDGMFLYAAVMYEALLKNGRK